MEKSNVQRVTPAELVAILGSVSNCPCRIATVRYGKDMGETSLSYSVLLFTRQDRSGDNIAPWAKFVASNVVAHAKNTMRHYLLARKLFARDKGKKIASEGGYRLFSLDPSKFISLTVNGKTYELA